MQKRLDITVLCSYHYHSVILQAPGYHLVFEAILIVAIIRLFFVKSYKPERTVLTEKVKLYEYLFCTVLIIVNSSASIVKHSVQFPFCTILIN